MRRRLLRLLTGLAVLGLLAHQLFYLQAIGFDAIDDAYISFRYADNLIHGNGLVFNAGQYVQGYTNFLWTLLFAPCIALHLPPGGVSLLLGAICGLVALLLTARFALPRHPAVGALAALLMAADGSYALWSVSGMETSFFTLLVLLGAIAYWREMEGPSPRPWSGILLALATLTRPEGAMIFVLTVAHAAAHRWLTARRLVSWSDGGRVLLYVLPVGAYAIFCWRYYGTVVPNTYTDKVDLGVLAQVVRGWNALTVFVDIHGGWWILLLLGAGCWALWRSGEAFRTSYSLLILLPYLLYIVVVGGDWSVGRFFVPLLPYLYLLAAAGLLTVLRWFSGPVAERWHRRPRASATGWRAPLDTPSATVLAVAAGLTVLLAVLLFVGSSIDGELARFVDAFHVKEVGEARTAMGRWLETHVPPGATIAVDAAGQMPYYAHHVVIDLYGLNTPSIARLHTSDIGKTIAGHEKFGLDYAIRVYRPDYIAIYGDVLSAPVYRSQYHRLDVAWTTDPVLRRRLNVYARNVPAGPGTCHFTAGFLTLHNQIPATVGTCLDDATADSQGNVVQHTTHGVLTWRQADNWTGFSDGYHTWALGPHGLQERLNSERFPWEPNHQGLPLVPGAP